MFVNSGFIDLLNLFNANKVKYLVVGGYAQLQYAEPRYTKDLDLWIQADHTNAEAIIILHISIRRFDINLLQKVISNARICESGS